jgi:hypothetical protein
MAFALWAIGRRPQAEVRRRVCARQISFESPKRWPTLLRWARASCGPTAATLTQAAARAAQVAIGRAPPELRRAPQWAQAFAGGSVMP